MISAPIPSHLISHVPNGVSPAIFRNSSSEYARLRSQRKIHLVNSELSHPRPISLTAALIASAGGRTEVRHHNYVAWSLMLAKKDSA
jgi:hypothetical protein